jgi:peptidyl-prolyl cis-trans isomerase A (cyclophilin A)
MSTASPLHQPENAKEQAPAEYDVKFATTKGDFTIHVTRAWAPLGADRFYNLVKHGFYTDAHFFRVLPGFVVQFGLNADPQVSRVWRAANIKDDAVTQSNKPGTVTFATAGRDTRTTQVFINLGNNGGLDAQGFAPFGQVTDGMDVVKNLHSGYGEGAPHGRGPDQGAITTQGKAYLDKNFPNLDSIKSATIQAAAGK